MTNSFTDALVKSVMFGKYCDLPQDDIRLWRTKMVSLFSLLHATALSSLHDYGAKMEVIEGIDKSVAERLNSDGILDDVYTVYAWIQEELMMRVLNNGIAAPPPISTRMWDDLTVGIQGYNNAHMIHDTPFPFPYSQIIALSLFMFTATLGFMMANIMHNPVWVVFMTFAAVSGYVSLNEVAQELEDPFGDDANDLPLQSYQKTINNRLLQLLYIGERDYAIPDSSSQAQISAAQYSTGVTGTAGEPRLGMAPPTPPQVEEEVEEEKQSSNNRAEARMGGMFASNKIHPSGGAYVVDEREEDDEGELGFKWVQGLDDTYTESDLKHRKKKRRESNSETVRQL